MLRVLLASQPARASWLGGTTFSTVTHGTLIALAAVSTGGTAAKVRENRATDTIERITYIEPARIADLLRNAAATAARESAARRAPAPTPTPQLAMADVAKLQEAAATAAIRVPDVTAAADLTDVADAWLAQPDGIAAPPTSLGSLLANRSGFVAPPNGIYTADLVEKSVEPRRGNPKPRYPSQLADMGIEGTFYVRFVVDSTGTVPNDKIEFPSTMHRLFASAVRVALLKSHYLPAMVGGHLVPQEVVQEFRFEVGRRR